MSRSLSGNRRPTAEKAFWPIFKGFEPNGMTRMARAPLSLRKLQALIVLITSAMLNLFAL